MPHYDYPRPMVTVDIFLLRLNQNRIEVLLIQRKNDPFKRKWALPGGFVEIDEPLEAAAKRELYEETGMENIPLCKLDVFGDPGRDPRGRTITIVYFGPFPLKSEVPLKASDDAAQAQWFPLSRLPQLAFDHDSIIKKCYKKFSSNLLLRFWFLFFLSENFSLLQVNSLLRNIAEIDLPVDHIQNILLRLPCLKKEKDNQTLIKQISDEALLRMGDSTITKMWQQILSNKGG